MSEPVGIKWKKGKDLTGGLLDMVMAAWKTEGALSAKNTSAKKSQSEEQKVLKKKMETTSMGGLSFFAWFGFIGRRVSAQESVEATKKEAERRDKWKRGEKSSTMEEEDEIEEEDDWGMDLEIFVDGDELALAFKEDLWPDAIKYFSKCFQLWSSLVYANRIAAQAQEQDALSDADFESDDEESNGETPGSNDDGERPAKKRRN